MVGKQYQIQKDDDLGFELHHVSSLEDAVIAITEVIDKILPFYHVITYLMSQKL